MTVVRAQEREGTLYSGFVVGEDAASEPQNTFPNQPQKEKGQRELGTAQS